MQKVLKYSMWYFFFRLRSLRVGWLVCVYHAVMSVNWRSVCVCTGMMPWPLNKRISLPWFPFNGSREKFDVSSHSFRNRFYFLSFHSSPRGPSRGLYIYPWFLRILCAGSAQEFLMPWTYDFAGMCWEEVRRNCAQEAFDIQGTDSVVHH